MKKKLTPAGSEKLFAYKQLFLVMKITAFLVILSVSTGLAHMGYAQETKLTVQLKNATIGEILNRIEENSEYYFMFNNQLIDLSRRMDINIKDKNIDEILNLLFEKDGIQYKIFNRQIVLSPVSQTNNGFSAQQPHSISGKVTDSSGASLPGVSVVVKGTTRGTITDANGKYSLPNVPGDGTLYFSFVGMKAVEARINGKSLINVEMEEETIGIEEVVAIGYGTVKKSDLTGSVTSIKSGDITQSKSSSFMEGIQGKMAGVRLSSSSGEPGAASSIVIRGANTVYGSSTPLFVIDGIPVDLNTDEISGSSIGNGQSYDPMGSINPSDIESIEVLKDASATAIYGSRGANGVVIVTTKSGRSGALKMDYEGYAGVSVRSKKLEVLSANEFIDYRKYRDPYAFYRDTNGDGILNDQDEEIDPYSLPAHDWQNEILRTAVTHSHSLSLTGGTAKTQYSGSVGYLNQEGIVKNNDYQRYNMRLKVDHQQSEKLKAGLNLNTSYSELNGATQSGGGTGIYNGIVQNLVISRPVEFYLPTWDLEGKYVSPASMINEAYKSTASTRNYLNGYVEFKPFNGLSFNVSAGGTFSNSKGKEFYGKNTSWGNLDQGRGIIQEQKAVSWYNTDMVNYTKKFKNQSLSLMGAFEINQYDFERFLFENANYPDESTGINDISKGSILKRVQSGRTTSRRLSYLGRANYSLLNRYLLTASVRFDGSDKFGPGNRYGCFPSFALAWRITEESFMRQQKTVNNMKLRLSYGETGNERIPSYQWIARMGNAYYNGALGMAPTSFANPDLKWESTAQYNAGLDLAVGDNRIELNVDYYKKQTNDMLLPAYVGSQSGYNQQWQNIGRVDNEGIELHLTTRNIKTDNFQWTTDISFSSNKNTVKDLGDVDFITVLMGGGWITNVGRVMEGESLGTAYGYVFDGVYQIDDFTWQNNSDPNIPHAQRTYTLKEEVTSVNGVVLKPGSFKFKDIEPDGVINDADKTIISHSDPKNFGGITNTFRYKNFELSTFFEWSYGNEIFNESRWRIEGGAASTWMNITKDFWYNRWTPENPTNEYGTFANDTENKTSVLASSYYVEDASWLRLKNVSLSYIFPKRIVQSIGLSNVRIYCVGNNLVTWTKYTGYDPEIDSGNALLPGFDRISYPRSKSYILGINVSF
jgi:TonB-linked SusC/RagA family outer membrane protein